jgi:quercetin dioxygenase-like cupin family protein
VGSLEGRGQGAVYRWPQAGNTAARWVRWAAVDAKDLRDLVRFDEDGPHHGDLFESEHLWSEVVCLDRNQALGTISDRDSDALVLVVTGRVVVQVNRGRKRLEQWGTTLVPAGSELTITNATEDPAVVLLVAAPPPPKRAVSE